MIQQRSLKPRRLGWIGDQLSSEWKRLIVMLIACLLILSVLFSDQLMLKDLRVFVQRGQEERREINNKSSIQVPAENLLGSLLSPGFPEQTCLSRYQSINYLKKLVFNPSPHLISKLRRYEALHKNCAPFTADYNTSVDRLQSRNQTQPPSTECNYLVWSPRYGLGNRILTLVSAFIYALLTDRVLLVDPEVASLFCEPFPESSWLLPDSFPLKHQINGYDGDSMYSYGNMLKKNKTTTSPPPPFAYLHLIHDYDEYGQRFFCDEAQLFLKKVSWLIMKSDNYIATFYFLIPSFQKDLELLFPQKDSVHHLISRYLLHPTNQVWGLATKYYQEFLANADEKIGIQIRVLESGTKIQNIVLDQIINCTLKENLVPHGKQSSVVLVTSLSPWQADRIRDMYWENHGTKNGEIVRVYQPSHEEYQQSDDLGHNIKAWTEMYLLSMMDKLVTSAWSTFGYVAQGLGGMEPWVLQKPENGVAPSPSCSRDVSMEPCFHSPPDKDCNKKRWSETVKGFAFVKPCLDRSWGFKLVDTQK